ncbi:hypothetical protein J2857_002914 [Neorhizobium galegae]|uniref:hypothetical protein n=1 Tax=Neorhizobium galegae TaxID=399 RepID=UPI001AEB2D0C|nr:hypothetical protein [Neorhizobium galegae]MBP2560145.1 hypothetical protein [Neorhizobium galegae]
MPTEAPAEVRIAPKYAAVAGVILNLAIRFGLHGEKSDPCGRRRCGRGFSPEYLL